MKYKTEQLINEYGSGYGWIYTIYVPAGADWSAIQMQLIEDVIGAEYYYGPRGVWGQVRIEFDGPGAP